MRARSSFVLRSTFFLGLLFSYSCNKGNHHGGDAGDDASTPMCMFECGFGAECGPEGECICSEGFDFNPVTFACDAIACPPLTLANGVVMPGGDATYGDVATLGCNVDFALQGSSMRTCQADSTWSGTAGTCVAIAGACLGDPCDHGVCSPSGTGYACACDDGFMGVNCDLPVMCSGLVAPNHGSVMPTSAMPGGTATYGCDSGYTLVGGATVTCLPDGIWSAAAPTCEPVACPTLTAPTHGTITATTGTFGTVTSYGCDGGYARQGDATRTCQADGMWSGNAPTCTVATSCAQNPCQNGATCVNTPSSYTCTCTAGYTGANCDVPVSCGALAEPANGSVSTTSTTFNGVATYECQPGFQRNGNGGSAMRTCQSSGTWSGSAPTCDPLSCAAVAPQNGTVSPMNPIYGAEAVYGCNQGYVLNGVEARLCQANGMLAGVAPTCDPITCTTSAPANGTVTATSTTYNSTVNYACNSGFMLGTGDAQRTCLANGAFSGVAPTCVPVITGCDSNPCGAHGVMCTSAGPTQYTCTCEAGWTGMDCNQPVDCGSLTNPANGNVTAGMTTLGNTATYTCDSGYDLVGTATRTCGTAGTWSGNAPTCNPITCSGLVAPTNGSVSSTSAAYPTFVTYACDAGYVLAGNGGLPTRSCQANGTFSGTAPTCAPVDCGTLAAPAHGTVSGATTFGSMATFGCDTGYMLVGTSSRTCTANATWSGASPTCEPVAMPCNPNPCQNGGTCAPLAGNTYMCTCPPGYTGGNCGTPVTCSGASAPEHGAVSAPSTTYNQSITYTCDAGYDIVGGTSRTCQANGSFSGTAPTCAPVQCTGLVAPAHGTVSAMSAPFMSSVTYGCDSGYMLSGNASTTCTAAGTWSSAAPTCNPVDCGTLAAPSNGTVSVPTTTFGSNASYMCNSGYSLSGSASRMCQANATWSGTPATCTLINTGCMPNPCQNGGTCTPSGGSGFTCACAVGYTGSDCSSLVTCSGATAPTNGTVSSGSTTYNSSVTYACDPGYSLSGNAMRLCQANGTFAGTAPTCAAVTCAGATAPTNGMVSATSTTFPNSITYSCNSGYALTGNGGSNTRTCQANMSFSGTAPTCAPITCSGAMAPSHGTVSAPSATFGNSVTFTCDSGYMAMGSTSATCQANGTFSNTGPTCVPVSCPALTAPTNGTVNAPALTFGSTATYACNSGFMLSGSASTMCQANQTWSNPAPTCTAIPMPCTPNPCMNGGTCNPGSGSNYTCTCVAGYMGTNCGTPITCSSGVTMPTNGSVTATSATFGNSVTYSCNTGYMLSGGNAMRTCQANGTFTGTQPSCAPVTCSGAMNPMNGTVSATSATYNNAITYTCNSGYMLSGGNAMRTCQANGNFSGTAPACAPVNCGAITITNGSANAPVTTFGSTATFSCNGGFGLSGPTSATCQASGMWTTLPTCITDCGALTNPTNGLVTTAPNNLLNATATYSCNSGFSLNGAATRTCQAAGWSGAAPTCVAAPVYCDVVYRLATGTTRHGTVHIYNNSSSLATVNTTAGIGLNDLLPQYGPPQVNMNTPLTPAAYPRGWMRVRFPANAAGTAPVAGPVSLIEFFAPVDADGVDLTWAGPTVRIALDGSAGVLQSTTVGCPGGAARCLVFDGTMSPVVNRPCQPIATGNVAGMTLTWDACSIPTPAGTTGSPSGAQLTWTPALAVASAADTGCVRNMSVWGGVRCTGGGIAGCGAAASLTGTPSNSIWDQELPNVTLSSATYATATGTVPEFIIPDTDDHTYTGARITNAQVYTVECKTVAQMTCDEQP